MKNRIGLRGVRGTLVKFPYSEVARCNGIPEWNKRVNGTAPSEYFSPRYVQTALSNSRSPANDGCERIARPKRCRRGIDKAEKLRSGERKALISRMTFVRDKRVMSSPNARKGFKMTAPHRIPDRRSITCGACCHVTGDCRFEIRGVRRTSSSARCHAKWSDGFRS